MGMTHLTSSMTNTIMTTAQAHTATIIPMRVEEAMMGDFSCTCSLAVNTTTRV